MLCWDGRTFPAKLARLYGTASSTSYIKNQPLPGIRSASQHPKVLYSKVESAVPVLSARTSHLFWVRFVLGCSSLFVIILALTNGIQYFQVLNHPQSTFLIEWDYQGTISLSSGISHAPKQRFSPFKFLPLKIRWNELSDRIPNPEPPHDGKKECPHQPHLVPYSRHNYQVFYASKILQKDCYV